MRRFFLFVIFINVSYYCLAQFSGQGTGTERDPYLVSNADELFEVRNDMNAYYKLVNDIDLRVWLDEESPRLGWNPIGSYTTPFRGHFDGNKKSITGMYINRDAEDCVGFFGCAQNAVIENLSLVNPIIKGNNYVSAIVGRYCYNISSFSTESISNVIVIGGNISSQSSACGSITGCIEPSDMDIKNFGTYSGTNTVNITGCYSSADIQSDEQAGGICGTVTCGDFYYYSSGSSGSGKFYQTYKVSLCDNTYDGIINAKSGAGILASIGTLSASYHHGSMLFTNI